MSFWGDLGRITPAHAGNSIKLEKGNHATEDHPRSCGEQVRICTITGHCMGSPPLMRGTATGKPLKERPEGITPAHAGNSDILHHQKCFTKDHPRSCGEQLAIDLIIFNPIGSPPLMRGTDVHFKPTVFNAGITPAHAGNRRICILL